MRFNLSKISLVSLLIEACSHYFDHTHKLLKNTCFVSFEPFIIISLFQNLKIVLWINTKVTLQDGIDDSIFFLGSSASGVSFHKHADAWNGVIYGRKRWFLYPVEKTPPGGMILNTVKPVLSGHSKMRSSQGVPVPLFP